MSKINQNEQEKVVNGVSVTKLFGIINAIQENPTIAKFNFRSKGKWVNGGHNRTTINDFYGAGQTHVRSQPFVYEMDEPPALSGCLTTALIYHGAAQGIKIEEVETTLSGDVDLHGFLGLDESVRNGFQKIHVTFSIKSNAPEEKLRELMELAQKRSPVFDMLSHPTPVEVTMKKKQ